MNKKIALQMSSYPKVMKEFAEENINVKFLCAALMALSFLLLLVVLYQVKKGPTVIALDTMGAVTRVEAKVTDLHIEAAIKEYIGHRYSWDFKSIDNQLNEAKFFVLPALVTAFDRSLQETIRFVREKKVRQKVYPKSVSVDIKAKTAKVVADRITEFDGLKAATEMKLSLQFSTGKRTVTNPWGIYIERESEGANR